MTRVHYWKVTPKTLGWVFGPLWSLIIFLGAWFLTTLRLYDVWRTSSHMFFWREQISPWKSVKWQQLSGNSVTVHVWKPTSFQRWLQLMMSPPPNLHNCSLIVMDKCSTALVRHLQHMWYRLRLTTVICSTHQQQKELIQSKQFIGDVTRSIPVFTRWVSSRLVLSLAYLFLLSVIYFMLTALCRLSSSKSLFLLQTTLTSHLPAARPFVFIILA